MVVLFRAIADGFATYHYSPPRQSLAYCVWSGVGSCNQPKPSNSISSSHHSNRPSAGPRNSQTSLSTNKELGFFCLAIRGDKFSPQPQFNLFLLVVIASTYCSCLDYFIFFFLFFPFFLFSSGFFGSRLCFFPKQVYF